MKKLITMLLLFAALIMQTSSIDNSITLLGSASPAFDRKAVIRIRCGQIGGTGIVVSPNTMTTAAHIAIEDRECSTVAGRFGVGIRYNVITYIPVSDYAELKSYSTNSHVMNISCFPMTTGTQYWLVGYPIESTYLKITPATALGTYQDSYSSETNTNYIHHRQMEGGPLPGMSGGPVIDKNGTAYGYITGMRRSNRNIAIIKEFADTPLCRRSDK